MDEVLLTIKRVDIRQCVSPSSMLLDDFIRISYKEGYVILATTWGFAEKLEASLDRIINRLLLDGPPVASHSILIIL